MSDPEGFDPKGFLARWSRRKLEAPDAEAASAPPKPAAPDADTVAKPEDAPPALDLSKLPSLESITAGTDVRAFLAAGVPEQLKRAALRRAWTADPAIRDFKGLSENAWDFTAPEAVPGFGPMLPTDDIARMVAQLNGKEEEPAGSAAEPKSDAPQIDSAQELGAGSGVSSNPGPSIENADRVEDRDATLGAGARIDTPSRNEFKRPDIAAQNDSASDPEPEGRSHGGAIPR
jgi:Protein of unknown function (DUF3306)